VRQHQERETWARSVHRSWRAAQSMICVSLVLAATGCSTTATNWESIRPTVVSGDRQWTMLTARMTEAEFLDAMSANGHGVVPNSTRLYGNTDSDGNLDFDKALEFHTYRYPYADYSLYPDSEGHFRLLSAPVESICTYSPDEGGAYESVFALTKGRTKELFANAAAPLGFLLGEDFPDEVESRSWQTLRSRWPSSIEEMLSARFEDVVGGTKVVVNTESDHLTLKSRDESFARSILEHMHCTESLLSVERTSSTEFEAVTPVQLVDGQKVMLSNYRVLSSAYATQGAEVEFVVASDVISNGHVVIRQGSPAWGEILEVNRFGAGPPTIRIGITKVRAVDGLWYGMALETDPLILEPFAAFDPVKALVDIAIDTAVVDKAQPVPLSTHIIFPIGRIVTGVIDPGLTVDE